MSTRVGCNDIEILENWGLWQRLYALHSSLKRPPPLPGVSCILIQQYRPVGNRVKT